MAGEAAGNAETSMELYEGVHSVWGKKITLPYGTATKGAKKQQQHLQGLSAINCHTCDYNTWSTTHLIAAGLGNQLPLLPAEISSSICVETCGWVLVRCVLRPVGNCWLLIGNPQNEKCCCSDIIIAGTQGVPFCAGQQCSMNHDYSRTSKHLGEEGIALGSVQYALK